METQCINPSDSLSFQRSSQFSQKLYSFHPSSISSDSDTNNFSDSSMAGNINVILKGKNREINPIFNKQNNTYSTSNDELGKKFCQIPSVTHNLTDVPNSCPASPNSFLDELKRSKYLTYDNGKQSKEPLYHKLAERSAILPISLDTNIHRKVPPPPRSPHTSKINRSPRKLYKYSKTSDSSGNNSPKSHYVQSLNIMSLSTSENEYNFHDQKNEKKRKNSIPLPEIYKKNTNFQHSEDQISLKDQRYSNHCKKTVGLLKEVMTECPYFNRHQEEETNEETSLSDDDTVEREVVFHEEKEIFINNGEEDEESYTYYSEDGPVDIFDFVEKEAENKDGEVIDGINEDKIEAMEDLTINNGEVNGVFQQEVLVADEKTIDTSNISEKILIIEVDEESYSYYEEEEDDDDEDDNDDEKEKPHMKRVRHFNSCDMTKYWTKSQVDDNEVAPSETVDHDINSVGELDENFISENIQKNEEKPKYEVTPPKTDKQLSLPIRRTPLKLTTRRPSQLSFVFLNSQTDTNDNCNNYNIDDEEISDEEEEEEEEDEDEEDEEEVNMSFANIFQTKSQIKFLPYSKTTVFPKHDYFYVNESKSSANSSPKSMKNIKQPKILYWFKNEKEIDKTAVNPFVPLSLNIGTLKKMQNFHFSRISANAIDLNEEKGEENNDNNDKDSLFDVTLDDDIITIPTSVHQGGEILPDVEMANRICTNRNQEQEILPFDYTILLIPSFLPLPSSPELEYMISQQPIHQRQAFVMNYAKNYVIGDLDPFSDINFDSMTVFSETIKMKKETKMASILVGDVFMFGSTRYDISSITAKNVEKKKSLFEIKRGTKRLAVFSSPNHQVWINMINNYDELRQLLDIYLFKLSSYSPSYSLPKIITTAITSPSLQFAISLINSNLFDLELCCIVFRLFQSTMKLDFLFRSLLLAEFSLNPFHQLFVRKSRFSTTLVKLFVAVSQEWLYKLALNIVIHNVQDAEKLIEIVILSFNYIPAKSMFIVRMITLVSLLNTKKNCHPLLPLFNFLATCLNPFLMKFFSGFIFKREQIITLLTNPEKMNSKSVYLLAPTAKRIVQSSMLLVRTEIKEKQILKIYSFLVKNTKTALKKFRKQRKIEDHPVLYTYYQNMLFLLRHNLFEANSIS